MAVRETKWGQLCLSGEPFAKAVDKMPHHVNEKPEHQQGKEEKPTAAEKLEHVDGEEHQGHHEGVPRWLSLTARTNCHVRTRDATTAATNSQR